MTMIEATRVCFSNYAHFKGRARRAEFWWFSLFVILGAIVTTFIDVLAFGFGWDYYGPIYSVFTLATLLPAFSVGARRLHDVDRSGWWQLLILVPIIGLIVLIVWLAKSGEERENRFGSAPN